jgi:hypothetical protein
VDPTADTFGELGASAGGIAPQDIPLSAAVS